MCARRARGASRRLLAAFGSAAIAWWLLGGVSKVGIYWADWVLSFWPVSLIFTMFAVGGCTHALNIVDGMNGLAGMVATLMAVYGVVMVFSLLVMPPVMGGDCGAADLQYLMGQKARVLTTMRFSQPLRVLKPGMAVTMDYAPNRLNIELDAADTIIRVACG